MWSYPQWLPHITSTCQFFHLVNTRCCSTLLFSWKIEAWGSSVRMYGHKCATLRWFCCIRREINGSRHFSKGWTLGKVSAANGALIQSSRSRKKDIFTSFRPQNTLFLDKYLAWSAVCVCVSPCSHTSWRSVTAWGARSSRSSSRGETEELEGGSAGLNSLQTYY